MAPRPPQHKTAKPQREPIKTSAASPRVSHTNQSKPTSPATAAKGPLSDTKAARRTQRHQEFVSRIAKRSTTKRAKPRKRSRPSKSLTANLSSLVDVLPDGESTAASSGKAVTVSARNGDAIELGQNDGAVRIHNATLKSRPGAQKKRAALEKVERDWFAKNLVTMVNMHSRNDKVTNQPEGESNQQQHRAVGDNWTALKAHIANNLRQIGGAQDK